MTKRTLSLTAVIALVFTVAGLWSYQVPIGDTKTQTTTKPNQGACYVGGCSAHVCSDTPGVASNCEYRKEYACYKKTSTCERQLNGECGWTQTSELKLCISNAVILEGEKTQE